MSYNVTRCVRPPPPNAIRGLGSGVTESLQLRNLSARAIHETVSAPRGDLEATSFGFENMTKGASIIVQFHSSPLFKGSQLGIKQERHVFQVMDELRQEPDL